MQKFILFLKSEIVLIIAIFLALISSFFVKPDFEYLHYIDFRTLSILFCLMCVMAGLQKNNVFTLIAQKLLMRVKNYFCLILILIFLCFFFSMLITNDVALITFVPFSFIVFKMLDKKETNFLLIPTIVLQTIGANLGSMLTPIGNPQNLYLYELSKISLINFLLLMLPYTLASLFLILIFCFLTIKKNEKLLKKQKIEKKNKIKVSFDSSFKNKQNNIHIILYCILFVVCLLTVSHILSYFIMLAIILICVFFIDKKIFLKVDYSLLFTFIGFFIFIGNMSRITNFSALLSNIVNGNEFFVSILSSQIISNVPASLLLSGFTNNYEQLIVGTNIGGLGTLIASMASLISYKAFVKECQSKKAKYLLKFTTYNIVFLILLILLHLRHL